MGIPVFVVGAERNTLLPFVLDLQSAHHTSDGETQTNDVHLCLFREKPLL